MSVETVANKHLLASSPTLPDLVTNAFRERKNLGIVLDLGAGEGRGFNTIGALLPNSRVVSLEIDPEVAHPFKRRFPEAEVLVADANRLPFVSNSFHQVIAVNSLHEICAGDSPEKRAQNLANLSERLGQVLTPGGELLFFDGFMPRNSDQTVRVATINDKANEALLKFMDTYQGDQIDISQVTNGTFKMSIGELVAFFTKYPYIFSEFWETERGQLYPFLQLGQMIQAFPEDRWKKPDISHPTRRLGLERFLENYSVEGYDMNTFPAVQVMMRVGRR